VLAGKAQGGECTRLFRAISAILTSVRKQIQVETCAKDDPRQQVHNSRLLSNSERITLVCVLEPGVKGISSIPGRISHFHSVLGSHARQDQNLFKR